MRCTSKQFIDKNIPKLVCIFTIIKDTMDVSATVVKLREKESNIRKFHDPVADTVLDAVGFGIVAKTCLREFYRTDTRCV